MEHFVEPHSLCDAAECNKIAVSMQQYNTL